MPNDLPGENAAALGLLDQWQQEDAAYDREAWARLKGARVTERELWAYGIENDMCEFWRTCGIASSRETAVERAAMLKDAWRGEHTLAWIAPFELDALPVHSDPDGAEYWWIDAETPA